VVKRNKVLEKVLEKNELPLIDQLRMVEEELERRRNEHNEHSERQIAVVQPQTSSKAARRVVMSEYIGFKCSEEEKDLLDRMAETLKLDRSTVLRQLIWAGAANVLTGSRAKTIIQPGR
jgi:phage terminase small subunit